MKTRTLALLAVLLIVGTLSATGCGGVSVESRATLAAALTEFELSAGAVTQALAAGSDATVASQIKAAKADMQSKWEAVVSAADKMDWPDKEMAEQAWKDAEHAIDSLADNATVDGANAALMPAMDTLMAVEAELWSLAQPAE